jgi:hypothetical protein
MPTIQSPIDVIGRAVFGRVENGDGARLFDALTDRGGRFGGFVARHFPGLHSEGFDVDVDAIAQGLRGNRRELGKRARLSGRRPPGARLGRSPVTGESG